MLRRTLLTASRQPWLKQTLVHSPGTRGIVRRFVAGESSDDALACAHGLSASGLRVSLDRLGEDTTDVAMADATTKAYVDLLHRLADEGLSSTVEVSLKLSALGQALDERLALDNAATICDAAGTADTTVTLDMEDHTTTDSTLHIVRELRREHPWVGAVLQSYLKRTEADCRDLAYAGSRVRLCKGAYDEPPSVAFRSRREVDLSYVRCLRILVAGDGYPMIATHDPRLVDIAGNLIRQYGRRKPDYEFQMLYGVRPDEQRRLANTGATVRVYTPYGQEWYGYLMRRLAERPANVSFFLRAIATTR